jgi:IMP dehydrogenase
MNLESIELSLGFEDVSIQQAKNICKSRLDVNIKSEAIRGVYLDVPLIAANMSAVINPSFASYIARYGGLGILHRALSKEDRINQVQELVKYEVKWVASSIGVGPDEFEIAKDLIRNGCNIITIDIAHGYSDTVFDMCKNVKRFSPTTKVIVGNTTSTDMVNEIFEWNKFKAFEEPDCIKLGIGQGASCQTKDTAGCTEKQFSAVLKFKELSRKYGIPVISDGGIRRPADFSLAISAGANSVMAGSIFARCPESAAETVQSGNGMKKLYAGMSSSHVQNQWKGGLKEKTCAEGKVVLLEIGEGVEALMNRYAGALRSGITYAGANDIKSFQDNVRYVRFK